MLVLLYCYSTLNSLKCKNNVLENATHNPTDFLSAPLQRYNKPSLMRPCKVENANARSQLDYEKGAFLAATTVKRMNSYGANVKTLQISNKPSNKYLF